jgi:hypothetical protein
MNRQCNKTWDSEKCIVSFSPKSGDKTLRWHVKSAKERDHMYAVKKFSELVKIINMVAMWNHFGKQPSVRYLLQCSLMTNNNKNSGYIPSFLILESCNNAANCSEYRALTWFHNCWITNWKRIWNKAIVTRFKVLSPQNVIHCTEFYIHGKLSKWAELHILESLKSQHTVLLRATNIQLLSWTWDASPPISCSAKVLLILAHQTHLSSYCHRNLSYRNCHYWKYKIFDLAVDLLCNLHITRITKFLKLIVMRTY